MTNIIELKDIHKNFGDNEVIKGISLDVRQGEFLTLLGPSGCGKTTTLRLIAGFEELTSGTILIDGKDVSGLPPYKREVNTVFQSYALFPLMNVYDNVAYGLTIKKLPKNEIKQKVTEALRTVQLDGYEKRKINELSGGQKQRVAIARALVNDPKVLLLDEPLGALDFKLRKQMQLELKRLHNQINITFIYVTHDQEEAMTMSDRIAVMNDGRIEQIDEPEVIYSHPNCTFVADFIGEANILDAYVEEVMDDGICRFSTTYGSALAKCVGANEGDRSVLCIRPEAVKASYTPVEAFNICVKVTDNISTGNIIKTLATCGDEKELRLSRLVGTETYSLGDELYLFWDADQCTVMRS